jgi:hypothetical protein
MTNQQYRELTKRIDKAHRVWARLTEASTRALYNHEYSRMMHICTRAVRVSEYLDGLIGQQMRAEDDAA